MLPGLNWNHSTAFIVLELAHLGSNHLRIFWKLKLMEISEEDDLQSH